MSIHDPHTVSKSDIEVLNQLIDNEEGAYRIRAGCRVQYLYIPTNVLDDLTMCRPRLLIPKLPTYQRPTGLGCISPEE